MKIALVINSGSGSMSDHLGPDEIRLKLQTAGFDIVPEQNDRAPLPERLEMAAARPQIEAVVVAGGDGTLACAGAVMAGREMPLGLLPMGTMNLLAKDLGLPLDIDAAIEVVKSGMPKKIDVAEVNGHVFLISSMIGLPARIAEHREAQRHGASLRGAARVVVGLARHLWDYPRLAVTMRMNGEEDRLRLHMLVVVNNDFVEKPGKILVREPVDGGRLTLYTVRRLSLWRMLRLASGVAAGSWHRMPGLDRRPAVDLNLDTRKKAFRVMNDGEIRLIKPPLRYSIRPKALTVIVPRVDTEST